MANVIWAPEALTDLHGIIEHIAVHSRRAADRLADQMIRRAALLGNHANSGAPLLDDKLQRYREIYVGNYRVIYRHEGESVFIVAVRHGARLLDVSELN